MMGRNRAVWGEMGMGRRGCAPRKKKGDEKNCEKFL